MFAKGNIIQILPKANKNSHQQEEEENTVEGTEKQDFSEYILLYSFDISNP